MLLPKISKDRRPLILNQLGDDHRRLWTEWSRNSHARVSKNEKTH